jgi:hypothetical protein
MPETLKKDRAERRDPLLAEEGRPEAGVLGAVSAPSANKSGDTDSWEEDQKLREYYYDDAHGYEIFEDDQNEDD